jgi:hypothetical protein
MVEEPRSQLEGPDADRRDDDLGVKHRNALYGFAGAGVVALVVLVISSVLSGGVKNTAVAKVAPLMKAAGCSFKSVTAYVPKGQGTHVNSLTKKLPWNTSPPSNGQHNPAWAVWGFYTKPVNPRLVVHNEEHGGVILWWGAQVSSATIAELRAFYNEKPDGSKALSRVSTTPASTTSLTIRFVSNGLLRSMPMSQEMHHISREACDRYAYDPNDRAQQQFCYALNRFIMNGLAVPDAVAKAIASVRNTRPGFVPAPRPPGGGPAPGYVPSPIVTSRLTKT